MIDFKQLMLFERHKLALKYETMNAIVVAKAQRLQTPTELKATIEETNAIRAVVETMELCFTIEQLMTLRYCLLAIRLELMFSVDIRPFKEPRYFLTSKEMLDI